MNKEEYVALFEKHVSGKEPLTPHEKQLLERYRDDFKWNEGPWNPALGDSQQIRQRILDRLTAQIDQPVKTRSLFRRWIPAAAAVLIGVMSIGFFFLSQKNKQQPAIAINKGPYKNDLPPGGNNAILTLASGKQVLLNNTRNGAIVKQGLALVNKTGNGQIVYTIPPSATTENTIAYNTITTPRGGQYQVTLPDGTNVWLNAASSLKFPTTFTGNERDVELTGEAYFEVAKNKEKPFKVSVNKVIVEVLGTHFNIMGYDNEPAIKTTLLEGSVKVKSDNAHAILVPGQQALADRDNDRIKVQNADVEEVMAWKNGYFIFHRENIQDIMKKVVRWYDVDVVYQGNVKESFGGSVSRFSNLSDLLQNLESTGTIHFKLEGRRLTVME